MKTTVMLLLMLTVGLSPNTDTNTNTNNITISRILITILNNNNNSIRIILVRVKTNAAIITILTLTSSRVLLWLCISVWNYNLAIKWTIAVIITATNTTTRQVKPIGTMLPTGSLGPRPRKHLRRQGMPQTLPFSSLWRSLKSTTGHSDIGIQGLVQNKGLSHRVDLDFNDSLWPIWPMH